MNSLQPKTHSQFKGKAGVGIAGDAGVILVKPLPPSENCESLAVSELIVASRLIEAAAFELAIENPPNYVVSLLNISRSLEQMTVDLIKAGYP